MGNINEIQWETYCADPSFLSYMDACKDFDPVGFDRALTVDIGSKSFDFRSVIVDGYLQDRKGGAIRA